MNIRLEVPKKYTAVSNGILRSSELVDKKFKRYNWFVSYPINNYNVTFYMGDFVQFSDSLASGKKLDFYVLPHNLEKAQKHFKQNNDVLEFYEKTFGPYSFWQDGFGMVESPYEGMEHQGAIAYGNKYGKRELFPPYLTRDWDYIIVHENAHEWWGNSVTVGDMADAWIHEGFATYSEMLFLEEKYGYEHYQKEMKQQMSRVFNYWPMVGPKDVNDNSFAGGDIYTKGACVLHSLRCTIQNDSLFMSILKEFYQRNQYQVVTTSDFIELVNEMTGSNFDAFFKKFLYEKELPELTYSFIKKEGKLIFRYKWNGVEEGFKMPFCLFTDLKKEGIRVLGSTSWETMEFPAANCVGLTSEYSPMKFVPQHSFTYYQSKQINFNSTR
jgi:aminopeptidase N